MHALDASGIVHGWDNYRIDKFPRLWDWIEGEIQAGRLVISTVALTEVGHVSPECRAWLEGVHIKRHNISPAMLSSALRAKAALGVLDDNYHPNGVDENDLFIIANAETLGATLISNEAIQNALPAVKSRYKIPAVCQQVVRIPCTSFLDYINSSEATF